MRLCFYAMVQEGNERIRVTRDLRFALLASLSQKASIVTVQGGNERMRVTGAIATMPTWILTSRIITLTMLVLKAGIISLIYVIEDYRGLEYWARALQELLRACDTDVRRCNASHINVNDYY